MSHRFIGLGFAVVLLALIAGVVGVGWLGVMTMERLRADAQNIAEQQWTDVQLASRALSDSNQNSQLNTQILLSNTPSEVNALLARRAEKSAHISALLAQLQTRVDSKEEQRCLDAINATRENSSNSYQRVTGLSLEGRKEAAQEYLVRDTLPKLLAYRTAYSDYVQFQTDEMNSHLNASGETYARARKKVIYLTTLMLLMTLGIAAFVIQRIMREIRRRENSDREVRRLNEELESRVAHRTADLNQSNLKLIAEMAERKRANEDVVKAKKSAEEASRAKGEFLANMSHEIRTPLNGVIGLTELVLDTALTIDQRENLEMVKLSANSLLTVINDILDFSKIEAGKLDLDASDFKIRATVEDAARILALGAHKKGLELLVDVEPEVPEALIGDPIRLRQIVLNLLSNAVKFTERGEVILRVKVETKTSAGICLHFAIKDSGIGIPEDRQRAIFEAFTQADSTSTRTYGGTGLGLTIASRLTHLMGGQMWVDSKPGQGSTFHCTANFGIGVETAMAVQESVDPRGVAVLVVDDNETNRRILEQILKNWGMEPALAVGAKEALSLLQLAKESGAPFPLVITDMQMPGMDGFDLAQQIKCDPALTRATVMMLTSGDRRGDSARCRELGVKAYLTKPVRQSELRAAVIAALSSAAQPTVGASLVTRQSLLQARGSRRVLLVEDNNINQIVASRLLESRGHSVVTAGNGEEALAKLEISDFDVVLMDVQMPVMDGLEATRAIREKERLSGSHLPIVALTAHALKGDRERCLDAGMDAYITKPLKPAELFAAIECDFRPVAPEVPC